MKLQNGSVKEDSTVQSVSYRQLLFRFADSADRLLMSTGCVCAVLAAFCIPAMTVLLGRITDAFVRNHSDNNSSSSSSSDISTTTEATVKEEESSAPLLADDVVVFVVGSCSLALVQFVLSALYIFCLDLSAARQVCRIRRLYLTSVLRQELAWLESRDAGSFISHLSEGVNKLEAGIDRQLGMFVSQLMVFCASLVNALLHGWKLTLAVMSVVPVIAVVVYLTVQAHKVFSRRWTDSYFSAAGVAMETFSSMLTVMAFGGQQKAIQKYGSLVGEGARWWVLASAANGVCGAIVWLVIFASYSLCFWLGTQLVISGEYRASALIVVFFSVMVAAVQLGNATPFISGFVEAQNIASDIFHVIDRPSRIDVFSPRGRRLSRVRGEIEFSNVVFQYPSRPDVPVLRGLSLHVPAGHTVALVGASGCGKSTCLQLLQHLYTVNSGVVRLDGQRIDSLNVGWLRGQLAVVPQFPVLFPGSIRQNIRYGRADCSDEDIERAARVAQAWSFIDSLPNKLDTVCGHTVSTSSSSSSESKVEVEGGQLSGGQRQRVAIARAVLTGSSVLLLDEATSALDPDTESRLLDALRQVRAGKTTIIVAHRLSTVARWADSIAVISEGRLVEMGRHELLMARVDGLYRHMFDTQTNSDGSVAADESRVLSLSSDVKHYVERSNQAASVSLANPSPDAAVIDSPFCDTVTQLRRTLSLRSTGRATGINRHSSQLQGGDLHSAPATTTTKTVGDACGDENGADRGVMWRLWRMSASEWPQLLLGVLASAVCGCALPLYALFFGDVLANLAEQNVELSQSQSRFHSLLFLAVGVMMALAMFTQEYMFGVCGVRLTTRLRRRVFSAIVRQDMAFFDASDNSVGSLCSRLSADTANVHGACGPRLGVAVQGCVTLCVALSVAIYMSWRLALVLLPFVPLVLLAFYIQVALASRKQSVLLGNVDTGGAIVDQAVNNISTVMSLGLQSMFCQQYAACLANSLKQQRAIATGRGVVFGLANAVPLLAYAACMGYGGNLVAQGVLPFQSVFKAGESLILGTMMVGQTMAYSPSYQLARVSAGRLLKLLSRRPAIDLSPAAGLRLNDVSGEVVFDSVTFRYPTRGDAAVLRSLSFSLSSGRCVALVGSSGCGKSTVLKLLLRLYDAHAGDIKLDDQNVSALNVPWLRQKMALVPQDCVLFNASIMENIAYGDNSRDVSSEEVECVAREVGLDEFIRSLPEGYHTQLGQSSLTQLSGGQRQRLAVARALVRRAPLLLLDEATSALDASSEHLLQGALQSSASRCGRTCLLVTHRLQTAARLADLVVVVADGRVVEAGTHEELMATRQHYYSLYRAATSAN